MVLKLSCMYPSPRQMQRIISAFEDGQLVCYPTDTVYGIGCGIRHPGPIELIYRLKGISRKSKPLSLMFSSIQQISEYALVPDHIFSVLRRYLPGPFTFILEARKSLPRALFGEKRKTIGVRIPDNNICLEMINELGTPIITTSLTDESGAIINDPYLIELSYQGHLGLVIDGGETPGLPSTVIDLTTDEPTIIREGAGFGEWYV